MKNKWTIGSNNNRSFTGPLVSLLISPISEPWQRRVTISKEAIGKFNEVQVEPKDFVSKYVNLGFIDSENMADMQEGTHDTNTLKSEKTDVTTIGSASQLIDFHSKGSRWKKCRTLCGKLLRGISCISLTASLGTIARLPTAVALHGGFSFLIAYTLLTIFVGTPLVFLELGIGQIVQQGVTRTWRAVPICRGVSYIKLVINMLLCIYYPLYIGLALFYLTWLAKGLIPFTDCANAKMTMSGYKIEGKLGNHCLKSTFLKSPLYSGNDLTWFGTYTGFIIAIWLIIMLCSFRRVKGYIRTMTCFFIPVFLCMVTLLVLSILDQNYKVYENIDWSFLYNAEVWYYATIQLFFSTHLGFGNIVTCAGNVYSKTDPFWAAIVYIILNIIFSALSISTSAILTADTLSFNNTPNKDSIAELHFFTAIYDQAVRNKDTAQTWSVLAYFSILLSGFISMLAVVFTILKAIRIETRNKYLWWQTSAFLCFLFCILGVLCLMLPDFQAVHILDHYVVGNLLLLCTILEVGAFVYIYKTSNIYLDLEFILGSSLSIIWKYLWWLSPFLLSGILIWALSTIRLTGISNDDPFWMYITGWSLVVVCIIVILIVAIYQVNIQVDYNIFQKFLSALKPSRKWGPVDPMLRHGWIQWRSTAGSGDRDFTLKRRGTRDYTHSVKNRRDTQISKSNQMETSTIIHDSASGNYRIAIQNGDNKRHAMEIVSITDTLEREEKPRILKSRRYFTDDKYSKFAMNPLGVPSMYGDSTTNESNSEGYGTIRNGPYIIANGEFDHVCWRKHLYEEATEL